jgi:hypothetical protein
MYLIDTPALESASTIDAFFEKLPGRWLAEKYKLLCDKIAETVGDQDIFCYADIICIMNACKQLEYNYDPDNSSPNSYVGLFRGKNKVYIQTGRMTINPEQQEAAGV